MIKTCSHHGKCYLMIDLHTVGDAGLSMLASCWAIRAVWAPFNDVDSRQVASAHGGTPALMDPMCSVSGMSETALMTEFVLNLNISVDVSSLVLFPGPL